MPTPAPFLPHGGSYKNLIAYQKAECVYDVTFYFAHHFLEKGDRTIDQMIQAARSGKQNIAEGAAAGNTSKETEIKLTNVAKASTSPACLCRPQRQRILQACPARPLRRDHRQHSHNAHPPDRLAARQTDKEARDKVRGKRRHERTDD